MNYSKWDKIELSDDEDVEVHPNVHKESFIKWRREAIHAEREEKAKWKKEKEERFAELKNKYQLLDEKESEEGQEINQELLKIEEELETEKKNEKLTSENISKDGFSKTIINTSERNPDIPLKEEDIKQFSQLKTIEETQVFLATHENFIGNKSLLETLVSYATGYLRNDEKEKAKICVRQFLIMQYCLGAQEGSGIYWVFKRLLDPRSEQKIQFDSEVEERYSSLEQKLKEYTQQAETQSQSQSQSQSQTKIQTTTTKTTQVKQPTHVPKIQELTDEGLPTMSNKEILLESLPQSVRDALSAENEQLFNQALSGLDIDEVDRILTVCNELTEEGVKFPGEDGPTILLKKIRLIKNLPNDVRFALQSANIPHFLNCLKNLPYEESSKILDDCLDAKILKLPAEELESLKSSFKNPEETNMTIKRAEVFESLPAQTKEALKKQDMNAFHASLADLDPQEKEKIFERCTEVGFIRSNKSPSNSPSPLTGPSVRNHVPPPGGNECTGVLIALSVLTIALIFGVFLAMYEMDLIGPDRSI